MKRIYFGTDGVRGPFGGPLINEAFAARLAEAAGIWAGGSGRVLIGRDSRGSGEALVAAVAGGLAAAGLQPVSLGVLPTPAVARAVRASDAVLGVVVTASHNPAADNGIKFFTATGIKLTDEEEVIIESSLLAAAAERAVGLPIDDTAIADYIAAMSTQLPADALRGWKIVLDTAHGATVQTSGAVLRKLGAEIIAVGNAPDGKNINEGVGSEHPEKLAARVVTAHARLGIAHDGDGDRVVFCDEHGDVLDGDEVLAILATDAKQRGELVADTLVITVQSNLGVDAAVKAVGGRVLRTDVGDRYVSACMRAEGAGLGGESSGHIICDEIGPTGDGLGAALRVLRIMYLTGQPLSELRRVLTKFPQRSGAVKVESKTPLAACSALQTEIAALESEMGESGRVLVRYSGTEPKLRLLIEGPTPEVVAAGYARLLKAAEQDLTIL
ncbi:phosphoglucosamine mutase [Synoicihabitans lomoniglobus]|uniref:Phosphoglucosamine mutase n=1 Tax=Synoicihabitans lomoniglobus TaxID=2909285 RepID=A0AAF0I800_9BACT|nr:phosphoglucosamine mutase [Opitutaceae bacterium LMO-M01]WED67171.1 phosphoglucosamine mutase [Opitutaceae bacterium LMO-M01]